MRNPIHKLFDMYALMIILYISNNPKTSSELIRELKIPQSTMYRKISFLKHAELICKIKSKKKKTNNFQYKSNVRNILIQNSGSELNIKMFTIQDQSTQYYE